MNTAAENRHILLQHSRTRLFYVRDGDWTNDPARAHDFVLTQAAALYSRSQGLSDARPVTYFHRPATVHDFLLSSSGHGSSLGAPVTLAAGS